jgi:hypothetical protein
MSDGIVDELLLKIGVKVDDKEFKELRKQVDDLQKGSAKIKPSIKSESGNSNALAVSSSNPEDKESVKDLLDYVKESTGYLKKISESTGKKDKEKEKKKKENEEDFDKDFDLVKRAVNMIVDFSGMIQQKYTEKLNRDMDIASLAYQTNLATDSLKELGYRTKIVGVSLESVVENAKNFSNEVFSGSNDQQIALANALGIDLVGVMRKAKTPLETAKAQSTLYDQTFKSLLPSFGFAQASARASQVSGLSRDEAFRYQHLNDKTVIDGARELAALRGPMGDKNKIFSDYEQNNLSMEKVKAASDRALSVAGYAQKISIDRADMQAKFVNIIAEGINGVSGLASKQTQDIFNLGYDQKFTDNYLKQRQHKSSSVSKAGGG